MREKERKRLDLSRIGEDDGAVEELAADIEAAPAEGARTWSEEFSASGEK